MSATEKPSASIAAGHELVLTRLIDAPRELVYEAWIDPNHLAQWWGPHGFTNPVCELDVRPGGAILIHMRGPDGTVYPMKGVYQEILPPERIVFSAGALDAKGNSLFEVRNTLTFAPQGARTRLTLRALVISSTPAATPHLAGMEEGWKQTIDRLASFVTTI